ncbi:MAG: SIS domain-containing protein [Acidobacteriota bacterium]
MEQTDAEIVTGIFDDAIALHAHVRGLGQTAVLDAARAISLAFDTDRKLLIFGNGGSAADSQHMAAELVGRFARERAAMPALALSTDTSILTSIGNDYSYDRVFARQIEALGRSGDVAFAISTSGGSPNVLAALGAATARGLRTIALTGRDGGPIGTAAEIHINVPGTSTARVQEVHITLIHAICELVERRL